MENEWQFPSIRSTLSLQPNIGVFGLIVKAQSSIRLGGKMLCPNPVQPGGQGNENGEKCNIVRLCIR